MKKLLIAGLLLFAASGSGSSRKRVVITREDSLKTSLKELATAADRLGRSADSLGKAVIKKAK
jgi:hypothetical protein